MGLATNLNTSANVHSTLAVADSQEEWHTVRAARVRPILGSERGRARIERDLLGEQALELLVSLAKGEHQLAAGEIVDEAGAAAPVGDAPTAG